MPRDDRADVESTSRRSVVPEAAGRSLWIAAIWTGVGAAVVCATIAIVAVSALWLPASSNANGRTGSAIHAGLLTFLAAVHGGITVGGVSGHWLPLGMLIIVGITAWRAGSALADVAGDLGETDSTRLIVAGCAQAVSFAVAVVVVVPFASLGTSDAPIVGTGLAALLLFACSGAVAYVRSSSLRGLALDQLPAELRLAVRAAAAGLLCYMIAATVLLVGSIALHHDQIEKISHQVGGGWGGIPILALGVLATPNALIYAISYLSGPGFALGVGTSVSLTSTAHGTLPAFPLLGAVPSSHGAGPVVWVLAAAAVIAAGIACARVAHVIGSLVGAVRTAATAALIAAFTMMVLGWQAGGSIGSDRLSTVGPSPWQLGLAVGGGIALVSLACLGAAALVRGFGGGSRGTVISSTDVLPVVRVAPGSGLALVETAVDEDADDDQLAG